MVVHGPYPVGEPRVYREVRVALKEGYEVDVIALSRPSDPKRECVEGASVSRSSFSHRRGGGFASVVFEYLGFLTSASLRLAWRSLRSRYDVVHVHNPPDFLIAAALLPKLLGTKVFFDIHDFAPELFTMRFERLPGGVAVERVLWRIERVATVLADSVITVHEPYQRELEARGVPGSKITVVMNSVDDELLPTGAPGWDQRLFRIVYHGTVTPHYGIEQLVEAVGLIASELPDFQLEIYGDGDAVGQVRRRASALNIDSRLILPGAYIPHDEVLEKVHGASVGVIANLPLARNELAIPTKLFEYVAMGIPVVSSDLRAVREHFSENEVLFYRPGSVEGLAETILAVARDPAEASARAEAALRRYDAYRWSVSAGRYATLLRSARHGGHARQTTPAPP
jgi:glycosyltransferase involved in cell wall biosynthesis